MKKEKRIPTVLGLFFLITGLLGGVYLTNLQTGFLTKASGDCQPINLQITNVTHNSVDISFTTSGECLAIVSLKDRLINDIRAVVSAQAVQPSKIHYYQLDGLASSTSYQFSLINDGRSINDDKFVFSTAPKPKNPVSPSNLAWGKVLNPDNTPANNSIVYLNIPGASPLSSYITSEGNWNISLANSYNADKTDWFILPLKPVEEEIIVISSNGLATQVVNISTQNNPVPDIIIGQDRFSGRSASSIDDAGNLTAITPVSASVKLDILNPGDKETLSTNQPLFFGKAPPNVKVIIKVESPQTFNGEIQSDDTGSWQWTIPGGLTPGEHTITATTQNPSTGLWETISRRFTVLATNDSPQFVASASATLAPSPTSMLIPTPTPTIVPTITKTPTTRVAHPSTTISPPVSGNLLPTSSLIIFGLLMLILGAYYLLIETTK